MEQSLPEELLQILAQELDHIECDEIRAFTGHVLLNIPLRFWTEPASTSGKYHPAQSRGEGGLARHTKLATRILIRQMGGDLHAGTITRREADLAIASSLLHDTYKGGKSGNQKFCKEHGAIAAAEIYGMGNDWLVRQSPTNFTRDELLVLCGCICWHMGPWSTPTSKGYLKPYAELTILERLVHTADNSSAEPTLSMTDVADPEGVGIG